MYHLAIHQMLFHLLNKFHNSTQKGNMKKQLLAIGLLFSSLAYAQNDAVTNAFLFNRDGDLVNAKIEIDKAAIHEKTSAKAKTWYFRGLIYKNIYMSKDPKVAGISQDAAKEAYASFKKTIELSSNKDDEFAKSSALDIKNIAGLVFNAGVAYYNYGDTTQSEKNAGLRKELYLKAIDNFDLAGQMFNGDTTAFLNANSAASRIGDYEKSRELTYKLFSLGKKSPNMYVNLSRLAMAASKIDSGLAHLVQARIVYPLDKNLALEELQWYYTTGRTKEIKSKLEESIRLDSTNDLLYSNLGNLYDQEAADQKRTAKDREISKQKAISAYRKAIKFNPNNLESNFNLGVYYFNRGAEALKKVNDLDINTYQKVGKKMEAEVQNEFKLSIPFFEECYRIKPTDEEARRSLKNAYERVGRSADAEKIK
jgi:hypothetical protein